MRNQISLAERALKENEGLIQSSLDYNDTIIELYIQLYKLFSKANNFEKVAYYQAKYISLKDSIYSKVRTANLMKIEAEHLEKENKEKIESQGKILALNDEVILRQKYLNVVIGLVALLLVALATVLIKVNNQTRRLNQLLDKKVKERTQELELNRDVLQRACNERDIIISKAASDIRSSFVTIKGLCHLGLKDNGEAHHYFNKLNVTSDNFLEIMKILVHHKRSVRS